MKTKDLIENTEVKMKNMDKFKVDLESDNLLFKGMYFGKLLFRWNGSKNILLVLSQKEFEEHFDSTILFPELPSNNSWQDLTSSQVNELSKLNKYVYARHNKYSVSMLVKCKGYDFETKFSTPYIGDNFHFKHMSIRNDKNVLADNYIDCETVSKLIQNKKEI